MDGAAEPAPAFADPQRLAQIVANLVENALKYATTTVTVGVRTVGDRIEIRVDDDGPGIAPDDLPHVFERLYTSRTVPGRIVGTGIGLAIVHELAVDDGRRRPGRADRRRGHAVRGDDPGRRVFSRSCRSNPPATPSATRRGIRAGAR